MNFKIVWDKVVSVIEEEETSDVYDITVENTHCFFADGLLAHNCLAGSLSYEIFHALAVAGKPTRNASELDDPAMMDAAVLGVGNAYDRLADALGLENVFPEIQFNNLEEQHTTNRAILEFCKRNGIKPVAAADSHYCRPELWLQRELYKKLGRLKFDELGAASLPKDKTELKCELYPKNAGQMWDTYLETGKAHYDWYEDQVVLDAIERSYDIAHDLIGNPEPDSRMKLPSFLVPAGQDPFSHLIDLCKDGMRWRGLAGKPDYVRRLKFELETIKGKDFSLYFITMKSIIDIAKKQMLVGAGRGSGSGSLVNYILGITNIDPLKYDLLFERFISPERVEPPDIDCAHPEHLVEMIDGHVKTLRSIVPGDFVVDMNGDVRSVLAVQTRSVNVTDRVYAIHVEIDGTLGNVVCNHKHRLFMSDGTTKIAEEIVVGDVLMSHGGIAIVVDKVPTASDELTDITVEGTSSFRVYPFDAYENDEGEKTFTQRYL